MARGSCVSGDGSGLACICHQYVQQVVVKCWAAVVHFWKIGRVLHAVVVKNSNVHVLDIHGMECPLQLANPSLQSAIAAKDDVKGAELDLGEVLAFVGTSGVGW